MNFYTSSVSTKEESKQVYFSLHVTDDMHYEHN